MPSPTRESILRSLRVQGQCTVKELAEIVGISPVSVRHHLSYLQANRLVTAKEVRYGVGRPHHVFSLTDAAHELFPTRYFQLTTRLLEEIKDGLSQEQVKTLFKGIARSITENYGESFEGLPMEERFKRLVGLLSNEGFDAEYEKQEGQFTIHMFSCPYLKLVQQHPEICLVGQALISEALSLPFERITCFFDGDAHCTFSIPLNAGDL